MTQQLHYTSWGVLMSSRPCLGSAAGVSGPEASRGQPGGDPEPQQVQKPSWVLQVEVVSVQEAHTDLVVTT